MVVGSARSSTTTLSVRLVRAVCMDGQRVESGEVLTLDKAIAADMVSSGKAVHHVPADDPPAGKPAGEKAGNRKQEPFHAQQ